MDRRRYLKHFTLAAGSLVTLPSWAMGWDQSSIQTTASCFTDAEEKILYSLTDALIPAGTEGVGALSVGVDKFLFRLFSDCYETEVQDKVKLQLQHIAQKAMEDYGSSFENCGAPQKMSIMEQFACSDDQETQDTFQLIKNETIRGFRTSKVVMTDYLDYQVIPGHFNGCAEVSP
jgi:hypothetical protein